MSVFFRDKISDMHRILRVINVDDGVGGDTHWLL